MSTRRAALLGAALAAVAVLRPAFARAGSAPALPHPQSLAAELARALAARKALVVMVSLHGCPYCKIVRESYLVPLRADGQPAVQVEMADSIPLRDLRGRPSTHAQVVREFAVRVAPTVLFLGRGGEAAAPPLAGMAIPDFYGAYLQDRVELANRTVVAA